MTRILWDVDCDVLTLPRRGKITAIFLGRKSVLTTREPCDFSLRRKISSECDSVCDFFPGKERSAGRIHHVMRSFSAKHVPEKREQVPHHMSLLEPLKQAHLASRDVMISSQICGSKLERLLTSADGMPHRSLLDDGCVCKR